MRWSFWIFFLCFSVPFSEHSITRGFKQSGGDISFGLDPKGKGIYTVRVEEADVLTLMRGLAHLGGFDFISYGSTEATVSLWLRDRKLSKILETISQVSGIEYEIKDGVLIVFTQQNLAYSTRIYQVHRTSASRTARILKRLLGAPNLPRQTRIVPQVVHGEILVHGTPSIHRYIRKLLPALDGIPINVSKHRLETRETAFINPIQFKRAYKFLNP